MIATHASVERVKKCVFKFKIYRLLKKSANLPHSALQGKTLKVCKVQFRDTSSTGGL